MDVSSIISLLMLLAGTGLFMVAGFAVCVALMIFCDIINLGGAFSTMAERVIALVFAPVFLAAKIYDTFASSFAREDIRQALRAPIVSESKRTVTV